MKFWIQLIQLDYSNWNLNSVPMCPLATFDNYCKLASSQSNRHKYRLLQNHRCAQRAQYISIFYAKSANSGVLHWVMCCHIAYSIMKYGYGVYNFMDSWSEKITESLFLILANANLNGFFFVIFAHENSIKTCEYSHLWMRIFGPSLIQSFLNKMEMYRRKFVKEKNFMH